MTVSYTPTRIPIRRQFAQLHCTELPLMNDGTRNACEGYYSVLNERFQQRYPDPYVFAWHSNAWEKGSMYSGWYSLGLLERQLFYGPPENCYTVLQSSSYMTVLYECQPGICSWKYSVTGNDLFDFGIHSPSEITSLLSLLESPTSLSIHSFRISPCFSNLVAKN
jgi:hypothetical protein